MRRAPITVLIVLVTAVAAFATAASANASGDAGTTIVTRFDPTGAVFTCPNASFTVLGGTMRLVLHDSIAADGSEHATITRVPLGVTLSDGTTTSYRLVGANAADGNFDVVNGIDEFTDATFFNILAPDGGLVARVAVITHITSHSSGFSFTFGECQPPQD